MIQTKIKKSIAGKVTWRIFLILVFLCSVLSYSVQNTFHRELSIAETKYMTEVIARISTEVNRELDHFIDATISTAQSQTIKEYLLAVEQGIYSETYAPPLPESEELEEVVELPEQPPEELTLNEPLPESDEFEDSEEIPDQSPDSDESLVESPEPDETLEESPEPLDQQPLSEMNLLTTDTSTEFQKILGYDAALSEIQGIADILGNSVLYVVICSIHQDNFFNNGGLEGDNSFTLTNRPFYEAYTTKSTFITDPYEEVLTGLNIITIAEPIFDDTGRIIGILLIQLSLESIGNIVTNSSFGETGTSMLMDQNNLVIAYNNPQAIGMDAGAMDFSGENTQYELSNPSGTIMNYDFSGTQRTGAIVTVSNLSGWKLLLGMDAAEFKQNISEVAFRLNVGLLVAIAICSAFGARIVYTSLKPLKILEDFMYQVAEGNLSGTVDYTESDEIGRLAQHMNQTVNALNFYMNIIDEALINIGGGDFTRPPNIEFKGDFQKFETSLDRLTHDMSSSLHEVRQSIEQMNIGSSQVASGSQLLAIGSAEQNSSIESLQGLIHEINEAIVTTAENSKNVTSDAENISKNLVDSNEKMQELVISVQDIRSLSDEVKRIIKSIEEVAFQTNILSLNASIEAARAGSAGRGFAIVADQVRMLSATTADAAEQTTKIINDIATAIETGTGLAQTTSKELQSVVDEVDIFVENISSISLSTQGQATAISEINQGIHDISKVVLQNSAISQESAASSQELSAQADQMLENVGRYKLVD